MPRRVAPGKTLDATSGRKESASLTDGSSATPAVAHIHGDPTQGAEVPNLRPTLFVRAVTGGAPGADRWVQAFSGERRIG